MNFIVYTFDNFFAFEITKKKCFIFLHIMSKNNTIILLNIFLQYFFYIVSLWLFYTYKYTDVQYNSYRVSLIIL